ncbi:MAG TPA: dicarboxylate/amino acid:cation symporter [Nitrospirales bacterium]|nr:dicarboxylate/amino acid:cation symporter [Nitrospirales bacterium]HIB54388.1 dicarboxylate/amino acid:cation symporter [Nitrospirales bacterium]HIO22173.1 dicarboxylate/amino acid:cation symporter [Nitrospirales bacterium]HIO69370.1 dicarboxylate/amino acid:cation symporter [Nitrospirales bacterium]
MKQVPLHWQILVGMVLGVIYGLVSATLGWSHFTSDWVVPFGDIFLNLLKVIAIPLIVGSIITGVASLSDIRKLSRIGGKTLAIYIGTTAFAITIGLVMVNVLQPGEGVPHELQQQLQATYQAEAASGTDRAEMAKSRGPLQIFVDMIPTNILGAAGDNRNMLQVVVFSLFFGIALVMVPQQKAQPLIDVFASLTAVVIQIVQMIMLMAPIGVFGLIAKTINQVAKDDIGAAVELLGALGFYCLVVIGGLVLHAAITYPLLLKVFTSVSVLKFFQAISPAQLLAFSTSSSGATLPVTMEVCQKRVGVSKEVSSFVLPLGATINMDGTALYQAVAAVFIAQTLGMGLDIVAQLQILLTAVFASIGAAAVPGAGLIILVIILEAIGVPTAGIALILGVDRILDMCRTAVNVTGDATVATVIAAMENELTPLDNEGEDI